MNDSTPHVLPSIGFIGAGLMGEPMAARLLAAGFDVAVHNRSRAAMDRLGEQGATLVFEPSDLADRDVIISMLPDLPEFVGLLDAGHVLSRIRQQSSHRHDTQLLVVMSSVSPVKAAAFGEFVAESTEGRAAVVDAPVSGGVSGATAGTLSIMVGASEEEFDRLRPVFGPLGRTILRMGPLGAGSLTKACNQLVVAATATALGEAVTIAERGGLDIEALLSVLEGGLANSQVLQDKKQKLLSADYSASGAAKLMLKDLSGLQDATALTSAPGPLSSALRAIFEQLVSAGLGDSDLIVVREAIARRMAATSL